MESLFIAKPSVTYASKGGGATVIAGSEETNLLNPGALALFTESGTLITAATTPASIANVKQFYIALGTAVGTVISIPIDRQAFHRNYCPYVAPVNYAFAIGQDSGGSGSLNFPTTLVPGTLASLSVGYEEEGYLQHVNWMNSEYVVQTGDVRADVVNALIADINSKPNKRWTASAVATDLGILITSDVNNERFLIRTDGLLRASDQGVDTEMTHGKGTPAQIRALEEKVSVREGNMNKTYLPQKHYSVPSEVDDTQDYDTYTFQWQTEDHMAAGASNTAIVTTTIAIPDGDQRTTLATILDDVLLTPSTGSGSSNASL
jgi:hypothetical protein